MFYKITSVKALKNYTILVGFDDGKKCIYDISKLCDKFEVFKDKLSKGFLNKLKLNQKAMR